MGAVINTVDDVINTVDDVINTVDNVIIPVGNVINTVDIYCVRCTSILSVFRQKDIEYQ